MLINENDYKARLDICKACPVFNEKFGTCGPPTNAINPFKKPHILDGVTFKPCGCPVAHLASYAVQDCPGKRWPKLNAEQWKPQAMKFLQELKERGEKQYNTRMSAKEVSQVFELRKELLGKRDNKTFTNCGSCMKELINTLTIFLANDLKDSEPIVSEAPIKKKRGRKPKNTKL
jgi:hypothetical protein